MVKWHCRFPETGLYAVEEAGQAKVPRDVQVACERPKEAQMLEVRLRILRERQPLFLARVRSALQAGFNRLHDLPLR